MQRSLSICGSVGVILITVVAAQAEPSSDSQTRGYLTSCAPIKMISTCSSDEVWLNSSSIDTGKSIIGTQSRKFDCDNGAKIQERLAISPGEEVDEHGGAVFIKGCVGFWFYTTNRDNLKGIEVRFYPDVEDSNSDYYRFRFAEDGYLWVSE